MTHAAIIGPMFITAAAGGVTIGAHALLIGAPIEQVAAPLLLGVLGLAGLYQIRSAFTSKEPT